MRDAIPAPPADSLSLLTAALEAIRRLPALDPCAAEVLVAMRTALADPRALGVAGITTSSLVSAQDHGPAEDFRQPDQCRVHPITAMLLQLDRIDIAYGRIHKHPWIEQVEDETTLWLLEYDQVDVEPHYGNPWRCLASALVDVAAATNSDQAIAALELLLVPGEPAAPLPATTAPVGARPCPCSPSAPSARS
jgi:hypothetical protein